MIRIVFSEIQDVFNAGASERVNALGIITHNTNIMVLQGQFIYNQVLRMVCVLVLIHQHVFKPFLVLGKHLGEIAEQDVGVQQQVVKIHGSRFFAAYAIGLINLGQVGTACHKVARADLGMCFISLRCDEVVLCP